MWPKSYRDYKVDDPLIKNQVSPSNGIIGCEMHDLNGWGDSYHIPVVKKKRGVLSSLLISFFSRFGSKEKQ